MRDQSVTRSHCHQCSPDRRSIGYNQRHSQHLRGIVPHLGNGRRNKSDDDQRNAEGDDLPQNIFDSYHYIHNCLICKKADDHTQDYADQKAHGQAFQ